MARGNKNTKSWNQSNAGRGGGYLWHPSVFVFLAYTRRTEGPPLAADRLRVVALLRCPVRWWVEMHGSYSELWTLCRHSYELGACRQGGTDVRKVSECLMRRLF